MQPFAYDNVVAVECLSNLIVCLKSDRTVVLVTSWSSDKKRNMDIINTWKNMIDPEMKCSGTAVSSGVWNFERG